MTDDEIRAVFTELRRAGVDFGRPPGLAIGTGFRDGELLPWLRSLPDDLGHEALTERLNEYVTNAAPNVSAASGTLHEHRLCPTIEQLHAGIDVLINEWDPLGARLGALTHDDVSITAYNALGGILRSPDDDLAERQVAKMLEDVETEVFGVRASPIEQRRYLARRLIEITLQHPGPAHADNPFAPIFQNSSGKRRPGSVHVPARRSRHVVSIGPRGDELPPLDPNASCSECGVIGTVAVVQRDAEPLSSRYCLTCWDGVRQRYWFSLAEFHADRDKPETMITLFDSAERSRREQVRYAASALWDDRLILFRHMIASSNDDEPSEERDRNLRWMADTFIQMEPKMYGPMPEDIQAFVHEHRTPA
jgi:hypothetical protein